VSSDSLEGQERLSLPALSAFATPGVAVGALAVALTVYLPHYYAGQLGLGLASVGLIFMAVRGIDMLFDPMIGILMDRTRSRHGRYRLWLAAGAPILMAAVYMLFDPPGPVSSIYLLAFLFLYYIGLSIVTLAHAAWASVIAAKYHERSRVFGVMQLVGILGATAVLILPVVMAKSSGASGAGDVGAMGVFVLLAMPVGVVLALVSTREKVVNDIKGERFGVGDYLAMVSRPDMLRIIIADFCLAHGPGWMSALYLFYFHDVRGFTIKSASSLLLVYIAAGVLGAAGLSWLAMRLGKHRTLMVASTGYSLGLIALTTLPRGGYVPAAALMFALGFLAAGFPLLDRAMVADVGDAVRLEKGKNRISLLYAMITTTQKLASAGSIGLSYILLGVIGYQPKEGAVNSPAAIHGLELVYLITPVVFVMLGGACYIGYRLDSRRHGEIRAQLDAWDAASREGAVVETLGGAPIAPLVEPG
jgi:GPH family glycoside/pentoside/hexuronide:cation symporter